jgi:biopolymer transport protein ExbB
VAATTEAADGILARYIPMTRPAAGQAKTRRANNRIRVVSVRVRRSEEHPVTANKALRFIIGANLVWVAILLTAGLAFGQDAAAPAAAPQDGGSMTMIEFIKYGGTVGHFIILNSVVCLGMSIERGMALKRDAVVPPDVLAQLEQLFEEEEYEEAMTICEAQPGFLTNVCAAGIGKIGTDYDQITGSINEAMDMEATKVNQSISYLNYLATLAPLMGLFGTVTGMIAAFDQIARSATPPTPAQLAGGIQQALVTTCQGLLVAMPFGLVYFVFRNKVQKMILEVGSIAGELFSRFKE